jgi:hypothetical protein
LISRHLLTPKLSTLGQDNSLQCLVHQQSLILDQQELMVTLGSILVLHSQDFPQESLMVLYMPMMLLLNKLKVMRPMPSTWQLDLLLHQATI